jgi:hypothetical protein
MINEYQKIIISKISQITEYDLVFTGSICDYLFIGELMNKFNFKINDIDVLVFDVRAIDKISEIFGVTYSHSLSVSNEFFNQTDYHFNINGHFLDVKLQHEKLNISSQQTFLDECKIHHLSIDERIKRLKKSILSEYLERPTGTFGSSQLIFKYTKKLMMYKNKYNL